MYVELCHSTIQIHRHLHLDYQKYEETNDIVKTIPDSDDYNYLEIKTKLDNQELFSYLYPDFFNYMYDNSIEISDIFTEEYTYKEMQDAYKNIDT